MLRIDRPPAETERIVEEAMRSAGIPARKIGRDERGRIRGVKTAVSATGIVVVDVAPLPDRDDACYVAVVGRYNSRSQIPNLLGRESPKATTAVRQELRDALGPDLSEL